MSITDVPVKMWVVLSYYFNIFIIIIIKNNYNIMRWNNYQLFLRFINYYISKTKVHDELDELDVKNTHTTCTYPQIRKYFAHSTVLWLHSICMPSLERVSPNCIPSLKRVCSSCMICELWPSNGLFNDNTIYYINCIRLCNYYNKYY